METFREEEDSEHQRKRDVELVSKDGECQQGLGDEEPHSVV